MVENSIEEDIKILENMNDGYTFKDCDMCNNYNEKTKCCDKHKCMELQAIEHILSDYKRVLKENEYMHNELDKQQTTINKYTKENEYYKECLEVVSKHLDNIDYDQILFAIYEYYISKQKVKAKIEELDIEISTCEYADDDSEEYKQEVEKNKAELLIAKKVLQQLLGSDK